MTKRRATYADIEALPVPLVGEIVEGELFASPRPASRHSLATSRLGGELIRPFDRGVGGPGGWVILYEPELHLGEDVLVPDLAAWRRARMPEVPDVAFFTLAPDWVCEVLSPSTARLDRARKLPAYARAGVAHAWYLDPTSRTLEAFGLREGRWSLAATHGGDVTVQVEPFDALPLELWALWAGPTPAG